VTIRTPTTKFFVALTDYLRSQTEHPKVVEDKSDSHWYKVKIDTRLQRLNAEQRAHISALAEDLVPSQYSVVIEYVPR
jgi:hypothetical protein